MRMRVAAVMFVLVGGVFLAIAPAAVPGAAQPAASLTVTPATVPAGGTVTVSGTGCNAGDTVFLISAAFPGQQFGGEGAVMATVSPVATFTAPATIPASTRPGTYPITARCGGANLGVSASLRVTAAGTLPFTGGRFLEIEVGVGLALAAAGLAAVLGARRRDRRSAPA